VTDTAYWADIQGCRRGPRRAGNEKAPCKRFVYRGACRPAAVWSWISRSWSWRPPSPCPNSSSPLSEACAGQQWSSFPQQPGPRQPGRGVFTHAGRARGGSFTAARAQHLVSPELQNPQHLRRPTSSASRARICRQKSRGAGVCRHRRKSSTAHPAALFSVG